MKKFDTTKSVYSVDEIRSILPHSYPMMLIDRVLEIDSDKSIVTMKNISSSEPALQGHFPNRMIYPGVLVLEGGFQSSALMVIQHFKETGFLGEESLMLSKYMIAQILSAKFARQVVPGDQLIIQCENTQYRNFKNLSIGDFKMVATVDDEVAAHCKFRGVLIKDADD